MMSTAAGVYGRSEDGKVPSANLVKALRSGSSLRDTQSLRSKKVPFEDVTL